MRKHCITSKYCTAICTTATEDLFLFLSGLDAPPSSWLVMPRGRGSEILVAIDSTLYIIDQGQFSRKVHVLTILVAVKLCFHKYTQFSSVQEVSVSYKIQNGETIYKY